mmetsp:Transcript_31427/g.73398  ORF Transcript_31427/g.73398 Transcript_31427/m.73398 type:complete len:222 (-) Transcript_31427:434-1099(-)
MRPAYSRMLSNLSANLAMESLWSSIPTADSVPTTSHSATTMVGSKRPMSATLQSKVMSRMLAQRWICCCSPCIASLRGLLFLSTLGSSFRSRGLRKPTRTCCSCMRDRAGILCFSISTSCGRLSSQWSALGLSLTRINSSTLASTACLQELLRRLLPTIHIRSCPCIGPVEIPSRLMDTRIMLFTSKILLGRQSPRCAGAMRIPHSHSMPSPSWQSGLSVL